MIQRRGEHASTHAYGTDYWLTRQSSGVAPRAAGLIRACAGAATHVVLYIYIVHTYTHNMQRRCQASGRDRPKDRKAKVRLFKHSKQCGASGRPHAIARACTRRRVLGEWVNQHRERQTIPPRSNIEPAQKFPHANVQSAPQPSSDRHGGWEAGHHTPSTASESVLASLLWRLNNQPINQGHTY